MSATELPDSQAATPDASQADFLRQKIRQKSNTYDLTVKEQKIKAINEIVAEVKEKYPHLSDKTLYSSTAKYLPGILKEMTGSPDYAKTVKGTGGGAKVNIKIDKQPKQPEFDPLQPQKFAESKAPEIVAQMQGEQSQIMQTNAWALNYWQYLGVWQTVAMTLRTFKMPVPNNKAIQQLSVQWATVHTKNNWQIPPSLEVALLCAGTAAAFGLPIAVKLGMFDKKQKEKAPEKTTERISDRAKDKTPSTSLGLERK